MSKNSPNFRIRIRQLIKFFIFLFFLIFLIIIFQNRASEILLTSHTPQSLDEIVKEKQYWKKALQITDSGSFYEVLKKKYANNYYKHMVGHIFGEILYDKEGLGGIEVCDSGLFWGCYHALAVKAISVEGVEVVHRLAEICDQKFDYKDSACHHGIGHGLYEYFGFYNIDQALALCRDVSKYGDSCLTGIFMEHHFPIEQDGEVFVQGLAELETNGEYSLCLKVDDDYKGPCFFELPRWWERVLSSDFEQMGVLCDRVDTAHLRRQCFSGIGDQASLITNHEVQRAIDLCQKMPKADAIDICLASSSLGFLSAGKSDESKQICDLVSGELKSTCSKTN